jgi:hypothetical protein
MHIGLHDGHGGMDLQFAGMCKAACRNMHDVSSSHESTYDAPTYKTRTAYHQNTHANPK